MRGAIGCCVTQGVRMHRFAKRSQEGFDVWISSLQDPAKIVRAALTKEMFSRSSAWVTALVLVCYLPVLWAETTTPAPSTPTQTTPTPTLPGQAHVLLLTQSSSLFADLLCS